MKTQPSSTSSTDALAARCASAAVEQRRPVVLTEAELMHIAAGGSRGGVSSGSGLRT